MTAGGGPELVVLLDEQRRPCGTAEKASVHGPSTPLHLAFSLHVRSGEGRVLLTRRAIAKATWPGVWTNAVCGHPAPGEETAAAIARRAASELGLGAGDLSAPRLVLPAFRYRAVDDSGVVENEVCPVYVADLLRAPEALPEPDPDEVMAQHWASAAELLATARSLPFLLSPWIVEQLEHSELRAALLA